MMESKHVVHNGVLNARMGILIFALNAKTNLNYQWTGIVVPKDVKRAISLIKLSAQVVRVQIILLMEIQMVRVLLIQSIVL